MNLDVAEVAGGCASCVNHHASPSAWVAGCSIERIFIWIERVCTYVHQILPFWEGAVSVRRFRKLGTRVDDRIIGISISNDIRDNSRPQNQWLI